MYALYSLIGIEDMRIFNLLVKLPVFATDLGVTIVLFRLLRQPLGEDGALTTATLWLMNPLTILASAFMNNFESIATLFILLAVEKLIKGSTIPAGVYAALAFCTRQSAIVFFPMIILAAKSLKVKKTRNLLLSTIISALLICTPFMWLNWDGFIENVIEFNLDKEPFGLTWWLIPIHTFGMPMNITELMLPMMLVLFAATSLILYKGASNQLSLVSLCEAGLVGFFVFISTSVEVGETFFVSALPLFLIEGRLKKWNMKISLPAFQAELIKMIGGIPGKFRWLAEEVQVILLPLELLRAPFINAGIPRGLEAIFGVYYLLFSIVYLSRTLWQYLRKPLM